MAIEIKIGIGIAILLALIIVISIIVMIYSKERKTNTMENSNIEKSSVGQNNSEIKAEYHKISQQEAKTIIDTDKTMTLVDVRTPEEYAQGHIAGSILIPDYDIASLAAKQLPDKQAKILVYCRSGARSQGAAKKLVSMGYTGIYDFGGIMTWQYGTVR